jgi:hypothetical protein
MQNNKIQYAVILNFESGQIDVLILDNMPKDVYVEEYIEQTLDYSLSNCEWMITDTPILNRINF